MRRLRARDERGTVAVITGLSTVVLFGFGALVVDLGNAFVRNRDVQSQADFAALGAADLLPGTKNASDPGVIAVADYLNKNQPLDEDGSTCQLTKSCVTPAMLVDNSTANGEVYYTAGGNRLRVLAPTAHVEFGLANAIGQSGVDVQDDATVAILSPKGRGILPVYVAAGKACDYGLQTLTDPANGQVTPPAVPTLAYDGDTNEMSLTGPLVPDRVLTNTTGQTVVINANKFKDVTKVGFFPGDDPNPALVIGDDPGEVTWVDPTTGPYTKNNGSMTVEIPASVTSLEAVWYVRLFQAGSVNQWSARAQALPLRVGDSLLECVAGSQDGNFGTLKFPRSDPPSQWIPKNIALGIEAPMTLAKFPRDPVPWTCSAADPEAIISTHLDRQPDTNCVDTDTGLTSTTATDGLVLGGPGYKGLLDSNNSSPDPDGSGGCAVDGTTNGVNSQVKNRKINNDILTCFLTDTTTTLGTIASQGYNGGPKLHPDIYKSPRFAWVPVFTQETATGGSGFYSILDFRPAFITDQPMTATKADNAVNSGTNNGIVVKNDKIDTLKVIFFHPDALPPGEGDTPVGPYLGVGPKVIRLVD